MGIHNRHRTLGQNQQIHRCVAAHIRPAAQHLINILQMQGVAAECAADHAVGFTEMHHHGPDQRMPAAHLQLGVLLSHAFAFRHGVIGLPILPIAPIRLWVHQIKIHARPNPKSKALDSALQDRGPSHQNWPGEFLIDHHLNGPQHALLFAFGVDDAVFCGPLRSRKNRLHEVARVVDKFLQPFHIGIEIRNGPCGHAAFGRCLGHRRRNFHNQPGIKRLGNQIIGAKRK